ncbi:MAG: dTMP kinase [Candidatus Azotimanducaceae bacterium]|jgi:dTMP kinase
MTKRGLFITIEGVEGVGKSTNLAFIHSLLAAADIPFVTTREPGGTPLAEKIRHLLLDKNNTEMADITELMLVFAARAQHVSMLIEPALSRGEWVVCDRFTDSTYAYQGGGRNVSSDLIQSIDVVALNQYRPDITLLLDLPIEVGLERASQRGELDRFERESVEFFKRVRDTFLARAKREPLRFRLIDAGQSLAEVQIAIQIAITQAIEDWHK